jgi:hypothetical protein
MCKYVWDLVIGQGGIGLVNFAVGIVCHLEPQLLELRDDCEVSEFFDDLKKLEYFNEFVKIDSVLVVAYSLTLVEGDLDGMDYKRGGFYAKYFENYLKSQIK